MPATTKLLLPHLCTEADLSFPHPQAHIGYFAPLTKIADFLQAGVNVSIPLRISAYVTQH